MEAEQPAEELAKRMREVVPSGIGIRVDNDMLCFGLDEPTSPTSGSYACQALNMEGKPDHRLA